MWFFFLTVENMKLYTLPPSISALAFKMFCLLVFSISGQGTGILAFPLHATRIYLVDLHLNSYRVTTVSLHVMTWKTIFANVVDLLIPIEVSYTLAGKKYNNTDDLSWQTKYPILYKHSHPL